MLCNGHFAMGLHDCTKVVTLPPRLQWSSRWPRYTKLDATEASGALSGTGWGATGHATSETPYAAPVRGTWLASLSAVVGTAGNYARARAACHCQQQPPTPWPPVGERSCRPPAVGCAAGIGPQGHSSNVWRRNGIHRARYCPQYRSDRKCNMTA